MNENQKVPKRIAQTVLNSLKGGVVPRIGLPYIAVGRKNEIEALLHDVEIIAEGGASFRFIVGRYGSGKSFLIQTIRNYVMDRGFIVADADLSPERRLQGTRGQGLATYREADRQPLHQDPAGGRRADAGARPVDQRRAGGSCGRDGADARRPRPDPGGRPEDLRG